MKSIGKEFAIGGDEYKTTKRMFQRGLELLRSGKPCGHFLALKETRDGVRGISLSGGGLSTFDRLAIAGTFLRNTIQNIQEALNDSRLEPATRTALIDHLGAAVKAEAVIAAVIGGIEAGPVT